MSITVMFSSVMFRSVMLVQLCPFRNDSPSPLPRLYRECRHCSHGTNVNAVPIPAITAVSVIKFNPITGVVPRFYRSSTIVPIPMQLSSADAKMSASAHLCVLLQYRTWTRSWKSPVLKWEFPNPGIIAPNLKLEEHCTKIKPNTTNEWIAWTLLAC